MTRDDYTPEQWAQMKHLVDTWKKAGPELEKIRCEDVRNVNTQDSIRAFSGMALLSLPNHPPKPTSGLVEQQCWFQLFAIRQGLLKANPETVARIEQRCEEYRKAKVP